MNERVVVMIAYHLPVVVHEQRDLHEEARAKIIEVERLSRQRERERKREGQVSQSVNQTGRHERRRYERRATGR